MGEEIAKEKRVRFETKPLYVDGPRGRLCTIVQQEKKED